MVLKSKPDWPRAKERWKAYWELQPTDRPCINVIAPLGGEGRPVRSPGSAEDIWFDPEYIAESYLGFVETTYFGGESVPFGPLLLGGWCLGCESNIILKENTIYHLPNMTDIHQPLNWNPGPGNPWREKLEKVVRQLLEAASGKFFVGYPIVLPVNDLLMLFRGNENFLVDLMTDTPGCVDRLRAMSALWVEVWEHFQKMIDARQEGCALAWPGLWSPKFVMQTQSDMSCMISADLFDQYVMTELDLLGARYERMWYHLDGPLAVRHLPTLLSRSYIKVIQYVPGSGNPENGPKYLELYRMVQAAGRGLDLHTSPASVEFLIRRLRPEGLLLHLGVGSKEQADELLHNAVKWCGSHVNQTI